MGSQLYQYHYVNFQASSGHRNHSLAEEPDTEYIAIVVAVVVFIVLFVTVNLVLDFFGVWFWVVFGAAFASLLLCMWIMCGPGCERTTAFAQQRDSASARTIPEFRKTLDGGESRGTISENEERFHELSKEVSEEGGSNSPSESESARMPSPPHLTCEPVEVDIHVEPPPTYEEALSSMTVEKRREGKHVKVHNDT